MSAPSIELIDMAQYQRELPDKLGMEALVEGRLFTMNARLLGMAGKAITTTALLERLTPSRDPSRQRLHGYLVVLDEDLGRHSVYESRFVDGFWMPEPNNAMVVSQGWRRGAQATKGYFLGYDDGSGWFESEEANTDRHIDAPVDSDLVLSR